MQKPPGSLQPSRRPIRTLLLAFVVSGLVMAAAGAEQGAPAQSEPMAHRVNTTKFTIADVEASKTFYENLLGMKELNRYVAPGILVEPFMGFDQGGRIGLLGFTEHENIAKTHLPVSVVFVPDLAPTVTRLQAAKHPFRHWPGTNGRGARVHVTDPSGNTIELIEREGPPAVSGARLIVEDIGEAEAYFARILGVAADSRTETSTAIEVRLDFGEGMFVALYEPKPRASFPRSDQPVVAIYTTDFDAVLARVNAEGRRVRKYGSSMFLADDPFGNVVEIIRRAAP